MNNIVKYNDPLSLFNHRDEFVTPFDRIFNDLFKDAFPSITKELGVDLFSKGSYPKVNIIDEENQLIFEAEIPGLNKDNVTVEVQDNVLTIKGEKKETKKEDSPKMYIYRELKQSSFVRSFQLNDNLDVDKITAKFQDGMLELIIPKKVPEPKKSIKKIKIE